LNILMIDDETLFRKGLRYMLHDMDPELELDEASTCAEAVEQLTARDYDLALVNLGMWCAGGFTSLVCLRGSSIHNTPFVALTGNDDPRIVLSAIENGAMGVIPKTSNPDVLIHALRLVLARGVYLPPSVIQMARVADRRGMPRGPDRRKVSNVTQMGRVTNAAAPNVSHTEHKQAKISDTALSLLTKQQIEILSRVITGKPNKIIGREMGISDATVKSYLTAIFRILGVRNRTEAVYVAARLGQPLAALPSAERSQNHGASGAREAK
jgi:DNA-binding NarL/FixJ family response regulator